MTGLQANVATIMCSYLNGKPYRANIDICCINKCTMVQCIFNIYFYSMLNIYFSYWWEDANLAQQHASIYSLTKTMITRIIHDHSIVNSNHMLYILNCLNLMLIAPLHSSRSKSTVCVHLLNVWVVTCSRFAYPF